MSMGQFCDLERNCKSIRPVASIPPAASNQTVNAAPTMGCMTVAASIQMNCIITPIIAERGAIFRRDPPIFHK